MAAVTLLRSLKSNLKRQRALLNNLLLSSSVTFILNQTRRRVTRYLEQAQPSLSSDDEGLKEVIELYKGIFGIIKPVINHKGGMVLDKRKLWERINEEIILIRQAIRAMDLRVEHLQVLCLSQTITSNHSNQS